MAEIAGGFVVLIALVFIWYAKDLPSPDKINAQVTAQSSKIYARDEADHPGHGTLLYEVYGDKNRSIVQFDQMPQYVKDATIAVEDKNFYHHGPLSFLGILRSAWIDIVFRGAYQGGSTITQQYVRNALLTTDKTFGRKVKEVILAIEIEQLYKKDDILKLYLNEIPYGSSAYGIEAAAKTYFGRDAKDLDLAQSALLAAIPNAPTYYSPYGSHQDALVERQHTVLDLMVQQKYITAAQADSAKKENALAEVQPRSNAYAGIKAPHFVLYVIEQLEAKYGAATVEEGGLKIITTLDPTKQDLAEKAITQNMAGVRAGGGSNAALVAQDPKTGQVLAMVGSYDFNNPDFGAYNVATALRQPGSSFKPITYSSAWRGNWGPGSTIYDVPTDFGGGYKPQNYDQRTHGVLSMRSAIDGSLNIPAVKTLYIGGIDNALSLAKNMGITTLNQPASTYGLSLTLGSGEVKLVDMVNAYSVFPQLGLKHNQVTILSVTDPRGKVLEQYKPDTPKRVLDPQIAYLMNNTLSDNNARAFIFGQNNPLTLPGRPVAAKTGTTESFRDGWTMGYTPSLVSGVIVLNNDNRPMGLEGVLIASPIWNQFMKTSLAGTPVEQFTPVPGIKTITLDANTGKLPGPGAKATRTDIFPSWYKPAPFDATKLTKIDSVSGKLATDCTPPDAIQTVSSTEMHAEIPPNDPSYARWEAPVRVLAASLGYNGSTIPTDSDNVHSCSDTKPQITSFTASPPSGADFNLTASITQGTFPIKSVTFSFDDQPIDTETVPNCGANYCTSYTPSTTGAHTFHVKVEDTGLYNDTRDFAVTVVAPSPLGSFDIIAPINGATTDNQPDFQWTASAGATQYWVYVDNAPCGVPTSATSTSSCLVVGSGSHSWYVQARDSSGDTRNSSHSGTFTKA